MNEDTEQYPRLYTDLAMEAAEALGADETGIPGVFMDVWERQVENGCVKVTKVRIQDEQGASALGKPIGNYVTAECASMKTNDSLAHEGIISVLVDLLAELEPVKNAKTVLVAGLGNWRVTPDALGPKVVSKVLVTRYMDNILPDNLKPETTRSVCAISPGVLGVTGIETGDIIKGIVDLIKPDVVLAIDALASRSAGRVNSAIQFSDTGLSPGSGMGTGRAALNQETLGVPVIAIGVPTVVDAATLVNDTLDLLLADMIAVSEEGSEFYNMLNNLGDADKYLLIRKILDPYVGGMFVTPKDVDSVIERLSNIIANALNIVLHPGISKDDINRYMY